MPDTDTQAAANDLNADFRHAPDNPAPEPSSDRLRAWEDEHLGPDTPRIGNHIELGIGAPLRSLSPELQREHTALVHLIETEKKVDEAAGKLAAAEAHHEVVKGHAEQAAEAVDERGS